MGTVSPELLTASDLPAPLGRYVLKSILGEGGMARVFRAELSGPSGFRKEVALKVVFATVAGRDAALRAALIDEARLGGLLRHPNIVDTYDFGAADGQPWIAMELVEGVVLSDLLRRVGAPPPAIALEIATQVCAGLHAAHELRDGGRSANLVHRDLKPSNIIVSRNGVCKVMDFGIAKAAGRRMDTTQTGMTKGTPSYMSPEQMAADKTLDRRSDVFSIQGSTLQGGNKALGQAGGSAPVDIVIRGSRGRRRRRRLRRVHRLRCQLRLGLARRRRGLRRRRP